MNILVGSVLHPLIYDARLGRNIAERLAVLSNRLSTFYSSRPRIARLPELRQQTLTNQQNWACLSGVVVKAANTRALAPWMVEIADEFYSRGTEHDRLVQRACRAMQRFYSILYTGTAVFTEGESAELRRVLLRLGATFQQLRESSRLRSEYCWSIVPKVHYQQHFADLPYNPRWVQNYSEESHVGTMAKIWHRSAHGRYRHTAQKLVLLKRLCAVYIRLEGF